MAGVRQLFDSPYWYYSHEYFLNAPLQDQAKGMVGQRTEYMFNECWAGNTSQAEKGQNLLQEGVIGCFIHGFVSSTQTQSQNAYLSLTLISRICTRRFGGKWVLRGIE